jgi:hypothetical protein
MPLTQPSNLRKKAMNKPIPNTAQMEMFPKEYVTTADKVQVGGSHYKDMGMQPWAVMEAVLTHEEFVGYLKGNVIKYGMRQGKKPGTDDTNKAQHYLMKLKEVRGY